MASTHEFPNDSVLWRPHGIDEIELFMVNDDVNDFDTVYTTLDETLKDAIIVEFLKIPKKIDIFDADIGAQESPISSRLDSAMLDYIRSRLDEKGEKFYEQWRYQLAKKDGGKIKPWKPRRVMPDPIVSVM